MKVLVATDSTADDRKTLAAVRSLGKSGVEVTVGGDRFLRQPFFSKFCRHRLAYPKPFHNVERFVEILLQVLKERDFDVLLPLSDDVTIPVSKFKDQFKSRVHIAVADYTTLAKANDKLETLSIAQQVGIQIPETHSPSNSKEVREISSKIQYPCVLKPRKGSGGVGLVIPDSPAQLLESYTALPEESDLLYDSRILIQEYVPGEIHDVCLLFNEGKPRAALTQKRLKMYHSYGGFGIHNETTYEPELIESATALLKAMNWHGPALVEFKIDSRDGLAKLMEVNSRFWGTLDLAIQAGVNFPILTCRMALDGDVSPVFDYQVGMRYKWTLPYGFLYALESDRKWHYLWEFLSFNSHTRSDIWLSDPFPLLAEALLAGNSLWKRLKKTISDPIG
ncbi:ATP-grasp domain-containing protein [Acidobacteriota bacterium]